jgi:excisionase family DNA binding protein
MSMKVPLGSTEKGDAALREPPTTAVQQFEPLLNDEQAARLLGNMHPRTLQKLARTGVLPAIKIGRFWFFRASALNEWINIQSQHRPCFSKEKE